MHGVFRVTVAGMAASLVALAALALPEAARAAPELASEPLHLLEVAPELSETPGYTPAIAFDGEHWLVVYRNVGISGGRLVGVRVDSAGAVVSAPFALGHEEVGAREPTVVYDGNAFVVAWVGGGLDSLNVQRVTDSGSGAIIEAPLPASGTSWAMDASVDAGGRVHVIACVGGSAPPWSCGTYLLVDDELMQQATFSHASMLSVDLEASDSGAVATVWSADGIQALRLAADGSFIEAFTLSEEMDDPALVLHDDGFAVAWGEGPQVRIAELDAEGSFVSSQLVETEHTLFGLGSDVIGAPPPPRADLFDVELSALPGGGYFMVSKASPSCDSPCSFPIVAETLSFDLQPSPGTPLQLVGALVNDFAEFSVASGSSHVLAAWAASVAGTTRLQGRLFDPQTLTVSAPQNLATKAGDHSFPFSAPGGEGWLVAWRESEWKTVRAARLDDAGTVVQELSGFAPNNVFVRAVGGSAPGWLVLIGASDGGLLATPISSNGEVSASYGLGKGSDPQVLGSAEGWLVIWRRIEPSDPGMPVRRSLVADRISFDGTPMSSAVLVPASSPSEPYSIASFDVVAEPNGYLVVFTAADGAHMLHVNSEGERQGEITAFPLPTTQVVSVQIGRTTSELWTLWREKVDCEPNNCPCLECVLWLGPLSEPKQFALGKAAAASPLRISGERAIAGFGIGSQLTRDLELAVADSSGTLFLAPPIAQPGQPFLSEARGGRMLLSAIEPTDQYGALANRVHLAFVEVNEVGLPGGEGGAGGDVGVGGEMGGAGSDPSTGGVPSAEPGSGAAGVSSGTPSAGSNTAGDGGDDASPSGGGGASGGEEAHDPADGPTDPGCSCTVVHRRVTGTLELALAALALVVARRYRSALTRTRCPTAAGAARPKRRRTRRDN